MHEKPTTTTTTATIVEWSQRMKRKCTAFVIFSFYFKSHGFWKRFFLFTFICARCYTVAIYLYGYYRKYSLIVENFLEYRKIQNICSAFVRKKTRQIDTFIEKRKEKSYIYVFMAVKLSVCVYSYAQHKHR